MNKLKQALSKVDESQGNEETNLPAQETSRTEKQVSEKLSISEDAARKKLAETVSKEPAVRKVVRAAARLADFITPEDRAENARVIREAKRATHRVYDVEAKKLMETPDHKTRLAATTLELAYDEGLPVKRSIVLTGDFSTAEDLIRMVSSSPAAQQAIDTLKNMGVTLEMDGEIISEENRDDAPPSE